MIRRDDTFTWALPGGALESGELPGDGVNVALSDQFDGLLIVGRDRTLASSATHQIIMDKALVRVAQTFGVRDAENHESKQRNNRYTGAATAPSRT